MKRIRHILILLCLALQAWAQSSGLSWINSEPNTTEGTDFWVTFMRNGGNDESDMTDLTLWLYATARENATVTVSSPADRSWGGDSFTVPAMGQSERFKVPNNQGYLAQPKVAQNKGVFVHSSKPISLYATNHKDASYDAMNVYPVQALSKEYVIQTYRTDKTATEFAVVATGTGRTSVELKIRESLFDKNTQTSGPMQLVKDTIIYLSRGQAYLYRSSTYLASLSGTSICANQPVAVFTGGQEARVPESYEPSNFMHAQVMPTDNWGRCFIVPQRQDMSHTFVRITAAENGTVVRRNGVQQTVLQSFETYEDTITENTARIYQTDKAAECFMYQIGFDYNEASRYGAPVLTPVIPVEQGVQKLIFATFPTDNVQNHYVSIVVPTAAVGSMQMDNAGISTRFATVPSDPTYSYATIKINPTAHTLSNAQGRFVADVYGMGRNGGAREAYAYSAGSNVTRSAWVLVDGKEIKEKTICTTDPAVRFTAVVNYEYESLEWRYSSYMGTASVIATNPPRGDSIIEIGYHNPGTDNVRLIITRSTPNCQYKIRDTINTYIHVVDKYEVDELYGGRPYRNVCYGGTFTVHQNGTTQTYVADTITPQWSGQPFRPNRRYTFVDSLKTSVGGCDSIVRQSVYIRLPQVANISRGVCSDDLPFTLNYNKLYNLTQSGTYSDTITTTTGCDSIINLTLTVFQSYHDTICDTVCRSDAARYPYRWRGKTFTSSGTYRDVGQDVSGGPQRCDSTFVLRLTVGWDFMDEARANICAGETYVWHGRTLSETGVYFDSAQTVLGCDSIYRLTLTVTDTFHLVETDTICAGDSYIWAGHNRTFSNLSVGQHVYYDNLTRVGTQCDSVHELRLTVSPAYHFDSIQTICDGDSIWWHGAYRKGREQARTSGVSVFGPKQYVDSVYVIAGKTVSGCDSTYTLDLRVAGREYHEITDTICDDETYSFNGHVYTGPARNVYDTAFTTTYAGCESVTVLNLTIQPSYHQYDTVRVCSDQLPYTYRYADRDYLLGSDSAYVLHASASQRCDSSMTVRLYVLPSYHYADTLFICEGDSVLWQGVYRHGRPTTRTIGADVLGAMTWADETYVKANRTVEGCDSTYTLHLVVHQKSVTDSVVSTCDDTPFYYGVRNAYLPVHTPGTFVYIDTLTNRLGCDSVIRLTFNVYPTYNYAQHDTVCQNPQDSVYIWIDGAGVTHDTPISIARAGVYTFGEQHKSVHGCDSLYGLVLTVLPAYSFDTVCDVCVDGSVYWQGTRYYGNEARSDGLAPGTYAYRRVYQTVHGCDSVYAMTLRVHEKYHVHVADTLCENETYSFNGRSISAAVGTYHYTDTLQSAYGCDSVVELDLAVFPTYRFVTTDTICADEPFEWRGRYFSSHDTICVDRYQTQYGCDSIYELRLHVKPAYIFNMTRRICDTDTLWLMGHAVWSPGQPIPQAGDYIDMHYYTVEGCDSIYRYHVTVSPTYRYEDRISICSTDSLVYQGEVVNVPHYADSPVDTTLVYAYQSKDLCDSVYTLHLHVSPSYLFVTTDTICADETYGWRGRSFNRSGTYWDSLQTVSGCDSIYKLELQVTDTFFYALQEEICDDEWYDFHGRMLNRQGVYWDSLQTQYGCDSVYRLELIVHPTTLEERWDTICIGDCYHLDRYVHCTAGYYEDTTVNEWGCRHYVHLHLAEIEPTRIWAHADSVCADDAYLTIHYGFEGRKVTEYSILYGEDARQQGFEDIHHEPLSDPSLLFAPMPRPSDPQAYPVPDVYEATLLLHNGICSDSLSMTPVRFVIKYPSWLLEQNWNDVISVLNDHYNGGFTFSHYQWYHN
ncbi:MAG: IgGFc-binding protein, partial [Paludibacteraceae bacterium]|nr:IgGFc-binding protein [Paludibacteraceae bacterium]